MNAKLKFLLFEAYRRNDMADDWEKSKPLNQRWLGSGTEAAYRPALNTGLMRFHDGKTPPPHCQGWLCLTQQGIMELEKYEQEFKRALDDLKADSDYKRSYRARYMLAGGISAR